jgi:ribonuclease HI
MLSGVLSIEYLCNVSNLNSTAKLTLKLISDSRILVNKINNRLKNRQTTNQHRDSDVDLEIQLLHEIETLISDNQQISIGFVRSHQELKKLKSELSHTELMNVMADASLTRSARKFKRTRQYTTLPQNPIDFTINDIIIQKIISQYSFAIIFPTKIFLV